MKVTGFFNGLKMRLLGFEKVPLCDAKNVLNKKNNFYWIKESKTDEFNKTCRILPTGTIIEQSINKDNFGSKKIIKPNGKFIYSELTPQNDLNSYVYAEFSGCKNTGTKKDPFFIPIGTPDKLLRLYHSKEAYKQKLLIKKERINKNRQIFTDKFKKLYERKRIDGENGAFSKYVINKETGDIVQFFRRNSKGETISGDIKKFDYGRGKEVCLKKKNKNYLREIIYNPFGGRNVTTYEMTKEGTYVHHYTADKNGTITTKNNFELNNKE